MDSALELQRKLAAGEIPLGSYYESLLNECASAKARFNCLTAITNELAMATVERLKANLKNDRPKGKLFGLPVVVKDNICLRDYPTTCASNILQNFIPPYNATVIERLIAEDAVIIAKANMDEFAMGSSNENSAFGSVLNPHDTTRIPGGSSGGSAVAVAAGIDAVGAWFRYRRLGAPTGGALRSGGTQADLWRGQQVWAGSVCVIA